MRKVIWVLLLCLTVGHVMAQNVKKVSGKVVMASNKEAIPFAVVRMFADGNSQHKALVSTVTNENGRFTIEGLANGKYQVEVSYLGFGKQTTSCRIHKNSDNYSLPLFQLKEDAQALGEVVVEAKQATVSKTLDKQTYHVVDQVAHKGGSVLQVMNALPGITVTQEGKMMLRGSDKVTVLIDGKQSSLTGFGSQKGLDNIQADNIEKIEVITNPSAKYQAQGMAGIVNLVYKKNVAKGWHGDVGLRMGVGEMTARKDNLASAPKIQDKYDWTHKIGPSFNLNYRTERINFFLQGDGTVLKKVNSNMFVNRVQANGTTRSQFMENRTQQRYNIKGGFDWFIDDQNKLTVYTLWQDEYHIDRGDVPYDYLDGNDYSRYRLWQWEEDEDTKFLNYAMSYEHQFEEPGHELDFAFNYTHGGEDELFPFSNQWFSEGQSTSVLTKDSTHLIVKERIATMKLDYTKPVRMGQIEAGAQWRNRQIPITFHVDADPNVSYLDKEQALGTWSRYRENIYSAYINWLLEWNKWAIEGGVRAEYSTVKYAIDADNIYYNNSDKGEYDDFNLFPNVRLTYKVDDSNKISVFVNRRIDRPGEFELRPFPKYDDPELLKTGNPYLRPQYTMHYELAYKTMWPTGSLFMAMYYKDIENLYSRVYTMSEDANQVLPNGEVQMITNSIPQNLDRGSNMGVELIAEQEVTSKWNMDASFNWYRNKVGKASGTVLYPVEMPFAFDETTDNTWNMKWNSQWSISKEWGCQASFVYYAERNIAQGKEKAKSSLDLGVNYDYKRWSFTLSATDLLNDFATRKEIKGRDFVLDSSDYYETQTVMATMTYKF